ncbi:MAG TPA: DUF1015 domain-containing protein [Lachnospiraceae bacterium]|nr:DUF1015 domain-containing protein [Lachnospiraceae bacterium]
MAIIKPFCAIRPTVGFEKHIAALPYDVYNRKEAKKIVSEEPHSFLKIDRGETQFPDEQDMYADRVYEKARDTLNDMLVKNQFTKEITPCFYVYEQRMNGRSQSGIVVCSSVDDYLNNIIKKHENTIEAKELDRIKHVDICNAQTGPIFLTYRSNATVNNVVDVTKQGSPIYDFVTEDQIGHRVWIINKQEDITILEEAFKGINKVYIADGHHRCASAVKVCLKRRKDNPDYTGLEEYNYFLSVLFPEDQLMILDYNRVVTDLNGLSEQEFLSKTEENFTIISKENSQVKPSKKGVFGMYLKDNWYELIYQNKEVIDNPVDQLDVSILQNKVLDPILNIKNPKTNKRIDFIGGIRGMNELEKRVHNDCKVAFSLYPTSIRELFEVADADLLMPPKSTWFEPKIRSGLFIHSIH